jgi:autotransporter-associated beta strand protein
MRTIPLIAATLAVTAGAMQAQTSASSYSQNFDSTTGTLPTGWTIGGSASVTNVTTLNGTTGGSAKSFTSSGDTAIGILNSGSYTSPKIIAYTLTNNTGQTINKIVAEWDYEKYRSGTRAFGFTFTAGGTGVATGDQAYAADASNTVVSFPPTSISKSAIATGTNIANNGTYALNWTLTGVGGSTNGQALGIDDVEIYLGVAQLYWDGTGSGAVGGGAGTWNSSVGASPTSNWSGTSGGSSYGKWNNTAHDNTTANFGGTGGAVALGSAVTTGGISISTGGYSITGSGANTLAFSGSTPTVTVAATTSATISAQITGSASLTKAGAGELILSGANNYTGATSVSAGKLTAGTATTLQGATGTLTVSGTGTLSSTVASTTFGGNLTLSGGTLDPNSAGAGTFALASNKSFLMDGGTWNLDILSPISFDRITGGGIGTYTINGGTLDLAGSTLSAGSYQILGGFAGGSGSFTSITGYNPSLFEVTFNTSVPGVGTLNITAIPEPHEYGIALSFLLLALMMARRRQRKLTA